MFKLLRRALRKAEELEKYSLLAEQIGELLDRLNAIPSLNARLSSVQRQISELKARVDAIENAIFQALEEEKEDET